MAPNMNQMNTMNMPSQGQMMQPEPNPQPIQSAQQPPDIPKKSHLWMWILLVLVLLGVVAAYYLKLI